MECGHGKRARQEAQSKHDRKRCVLVARSTLPLPTHQGRLAVFKRRNRGGEGGIV